MSCCCTTSHAESVDEFVKLLLFIKIIAPSTHFLLFFNTFLSQAEPAPFPKQRSAGDKSSNQLPLLPFNSKNGPLNWILSALTHILCATIFMLPIQNVPLLSCHVNHMVGTDSLHYILTNSLNISRREHDIRSKVFLFSLQKAPNLRAPSGTGVTTWAGIFKKKKKVRR